MAFEKIQSSALDYLKIQTGALNYLNDTITFYYLLKEKLLSDDGYTFYEARTHNFQNNQNIEALAKQCCERFFCEFDETNKEFIYRLNDENEKQDGINRLIQVITMFEILFYKEKYQERY